MLKNNFLNLINPKPRFFNAINFLKTKSVAEIYLVIVLLLYPILPSYFVIFGARVTTILALGCLLLLFSTPQFYKLRLTGIKLMIMLIIFLCYLMSAISNKEVFTSGFLSEICNYFIIPLYCAVLIDTKEKFDKCCTLLIASAMVLCVLSLTELFFGFNLFSLIETVDLGHVGSGSSARFGIYRIESSFGQAIAFAIYLSFIVCLVFYKLYNKNNASSFMQNIYLFCLLLLTLFIFLTGSRFPLLVVLVSYLAFFFKLQKKTKIKLLIILAIAIVGVVIFGLIKGNSFFKELFDSIIAIFKGDTSDRTQENTANYRLSLFKYSKLVVGNDYFFGRGLHVNTAFVHLSPNYGLFQSYSFDNGFIYIYLQQGIVGLIAWISLTYSIIVSVILSYKKGENDHINFPIAVLVAVCLLNMFSVARLDESRAFMMIIGCYLGLDFHLYKFEESQKKAKAA